MEGEATQYKIKTNNNEQQQINHSLQSSSYNMQNLQPTQLCQNVKRDVQLYLSFSPFTSTTMWPDVRSISVYPYEEAAVTKASSSGDSPW